MSEETKEEAQNVPISTDERLAALEKKLDAVFASSEKTRKYILGMLIAGLIGFILPLIGLAFAIPTYISTLQSYAAF